MDSSIQIFYVKIHLISIIHLKKNYNFSDLKNWK